MTAIAPPCPPNPVTIDQIQDPAHPAHVPEGCTVQLTGVVLTTQVFPTGIQDSFYVQEPTSGPWSGVFIYCNGIDASLLLMGDEVTVAGTVQEYYGMTEIVADAVSWTGTAALPAPLPVMPAEVNDTGPLSEAYEGVLLRLEDVTTTLTPFVGTDLTDHGDFLVARPSDPSAELVVGWQMKHAFACPESRMGTSCTRDYRWQGQSIRSITGVLEYSWDHFRLQPRSIGDVDFDEVIDPFRVELYEMVANHIALSYDQARLEMYASIDNLAGQVQCVYTGQWVNTDTIPPIEVMNTEHTWPQSWGSDVMPARSDLHHLFPVMYAANLARSNHPFGEVVVVDWSQGGSLRGQDADNRTVFEPRDAHKGDAARATFYYAIRYDANIPDYLEDVLRVWNQQDPPDAKEFGRNDAIAALQATRNPFVDHPEYVDRIGNF